MLPEENRNLLSHKIIYLNFILAIFVVILHSSCAAFLNESWSMYQVVKMLDSICAIIADCAVPTFYLMSAFLFYRTFKLTKYLEKVTKRLRTLIVPYLFWSILFLVYFIVLSHIPSVANLMNQEPVSMKPLDLINSILFASYDPPIWFIRVLFIYVVFAPVIYIIMTILKKYSIILCIFVLLINIKIGFGYSTPMFWLPVYLLGAWFGIYNEKLVLEFPLIKSKRRLKLVIICCLEISLVLFAYYFGTQSKTYYLYRMFSPILLWLLMDYVNFNKKPRWWHYNAFFIFCLHYIVIQVVRRVWIMLIGTNSLMVLLAHVLTIVFSLLIIYGLAYMLKKYCSPFWSLITGGR